MCTLDSTVKNVSLIDLTRRLPNGSLEQIGSGPDRLANPSKTDCVSSDYIAPPHEQIDTMHRTLKLDTCPAAVSTHTSPYGLPKKKTLSPTWILEPTGSSCHVSPPSLYILISLPCVSSFKRRVTCLAQEESRVTARKRERQ